LGLELFERFEKLLEQNAALHPRAESAGRKRPRQSEPGDFFSIAHQEWLSSYNTSNQGDYVTHSQASMVALVGLLQAVSHAHQSMSSEFTDRLLERARRMLYDRQPAGQLVGLRSIFSQLQGHNSEQVWTGAELALHEEVIFPVAPSARQTVRQQDDLLERFEAHKAWAFDPLSQVENLLGLLQVRHWASPALIRGNLLDESVSLYDALRVQAALAACLTFTAESEAVALLLEGDISGVQRFLYTVPSSGAAKQLRARSLYLQMLTEAVARLILRRYELPITNLIYAGGGHFYLLLPAQAEIAELQAAVDDVLLRHHDGELYIALGGVKLSEGDFKPQPFMERWKALKSDTGRSKNRRYSHLESNRMMESVFSPRQMMGEAGQRYADRDEREMSGEERPRAESALGRSYEALGRALTEAEYLLLSEIPPQQEVPSGYQAVLRELGMNLQLLDERGKLLEDAESAPISDRTRAVLYGLRQTPDAALMQQLVKSGAAQGIPLAGRLRPTVNQIARKNRHSVAEFSELAEASEGIKRLGVLRMDVDDLGSLFRDGFQNKASLARVASLSSALSLFFEGWVGELCKQFNQAYRTRLAQAARADRVDEIEAIYAVYSGGDDLFIVGRWDVLPLLAQRISEDFKRFACHNPYIHISAGITLHSGKYPLYQAAEEAEEALKRAKDRPGKDSFSFLGQAHPWSAWDDLLQLRDEIIDLSQQKSIGRAIIQTLLRFYEAYEEAVKQAQSGKGRIVWGAYLWRTAYQLSRLMERATDNNLSLERFRQLALRPSEESFNALALLGLAACWADIQTRKRQED